MIHCPNCYGTNTIKYGINWQNKRQKRLCKDCAYIFQGEVIEKPAGQVIKQNLQAQNQPSAKTGGPNE